MRSGNSPSRPALRLAGCWERVAHRPEAADLCPRCQVRRTVLLENLRYPVIADLQLRTPPRIYDDEAILFRQGDGASNVFLIESGEVALFLSTLDRRRVFVKTAGPGEVLGLASALEDLDYVATARALAPLRVGALGSQDLHFLCRRHPGLRQAVETCVKAAHATTPGRSIPSGATASSPLRAALRFFSKKPVRPSE